MKALTLWRPWPFAIFHLPPDIAKRVENRSWRPPDWLIGERIAIHAGATYDRDGAELIGEHLADIGRLAELKKVPGHDARVKAEGIIGTAVVCGVCRPTLAGAELLSGRFPANNQPILSWLSGPYGWLLDDVRALPEPIPCKGQRGLWDVPEELVGRLS